MLSQNKWCEIQTKLDQYRSELTKWCRKSQKELKRALEEKIQQLSLLKQIDRVNKSELINQIDEEILTLLEAEDMKWQQWVKQNWYQLGDKNSKFFHIYAT